MKTKIKLDGISIRFHIEDEKHNYQGQFDLTINPNSNKDGSSLLYSYGANNVSIEDLKKISKVADKTYDVSPRLESIVNEIMKDTE